MVSKIEQSRAEHERLAAHMVEARASLEQTRTQLAVVEEQARLAEAELARLESGADAVNANIISQKRAQAVQARGQVTNVGLAITQIQRELESRGRQLEASAKAIAASERMVELVRASPGLLPDSAAHGDDLGRVRLAATRDGVVTRRDAWPGQGVASGEALLHVVDYSVVQIDGELPESLVGRFDGASGQVVRIRIGNTEHSRRLVGTGRVLAISPLVNAVKRTAHLVIEAANPDGALREGMYVELHVVLRQAADAVVVPASAVLTEGPMHFVFVEEDGVFIKHDIVPGVRDDRFVEVIDGLVPGRQGGRPRRLCVDATPRSRRRGRPRPRSRTQPLTGPQESTRAQDDHPNLAPESRPHARRGGRAVRVRLHRREVAARRCTA